jgi:hypothetical protein
VRVKAERRRIIGQFHRLRAEIDQIFVDCAYWNDNVRKPTEEPINPDPFGELRRLVTALDELLANDTGHGPIAPLNFTRSQ